MFEEIKKKYPKAWGVFTEWCFNIDLYDRWDQDGEITITEEFEFTNLIGWLFRFFDEQNLVVMVTLSGRWFWRVCSLSIPTVWSNLKTPGLNNRQEAEQAAFAKAFEILEDK